MALVQSPLDSRRLLYETSYNVGRISHKTCKQLLVDSIHAVAKFLWFSHVVYKHGGALVGPLYPRLQQTERLFSSVGVPKGFLQLLMEVVSCYQACVVILVQCTSNVL